MADYTLSVDIKANDEASETFKKIAENANNFKSKVEAAGESMQKTGKKMQDTGDTLTKKISVPLVGVGTASAKLASDFETSMAKVSTIADSTQVPMKDLRQQILDLSNDTGVAAADIAESTYQAISAGRSTGEAVSFVAEASKLSKAGFADTTTSVDTLTTVMNSYGDAAGDVTSISDRLIKTQNLGKTALADLGSNIGKVIPTAGIYNVSLNNLAAAYVTTTKNGISTAESTTYIKSMLGELGKTGSDVSNILKEKTGKSFSELMASGMSLSDAMGIIQQHCAEAGLSIGDVFSSQEAGNAAAVLVQHAEDFNNAMTEIGDSAGTMQSAFDKMDATNASDTAKALNQIKNAGVELGEAVLPVVVPVFTQLSEVVKGAADAFAGLPQELQQMIIQGGAAAIALGPLITIGGKVVSGAGTVVSGIGKIAGGIGGLAEKAGSATSPVSSSATAVGSLSKNALGLVAAGAGILMASAGLALLAQSAIKIAKEGPGAGIAMAAMVGSVGALAFGAAALGPALNAGAFGIAAFGASIDMIGHGIGAATGGVTKLAAQLPTISNYGGSAAAGLLKLSGALLPLSGSAFALGGSLITLGGGLIATGGGLIILGGGAGVAAFSVGALTLSVKLLEAGIKGVSVQMEVISHTSKSSAKDLRSMVSSVDVVKSGLDGLKTVAQNSVSRFVAAFSSGTPNAQTAAMKMGNAVTMSLTASLLQASVVTTMHSMMIANNMNIGLIAMNRNVQSQMQSALQTVQTTLAQMQSEFRNTSFEFNHHIALPHFNMSGAFNAETGAVPKTSVSWYKKGYDQSYMFTTPTVVGASGFGDGNGAEIVSGDDHLIDLMRDAFEGMGGGTTVIPVYIGQERIDELVVNATQRSNYRSGGR